MSYSYDLRKRVEAYVVGGGKKTEAAQLFRVHVQTIHNWMRMEGGVGSAGKPGPTTGRIVKHDALKPSHCRAPQGPPERAGQTFSCTQPRLPLRVKNGASPVKKTWGDKERDPMKRKA